MTLATKNPTEIATNSIWENETSILDIKNIFCPTATDSEFKVFCAMGKATNLNPFLREIWMVKYDKSKANIFIGRDGYRKAAFRDANYGGHYVDVVYPGEEFSYNYNDSTVTHKKSMKVRTKADKPLGAYAIVHVKRFERPFYVWVDLYEYDTNQSNWAKMPATMIKKVAEAQALRMACPEILGATYSAEEQEVIEHNRDKTKPSNKLEKIMQENGSSMDEKGNEIIESEEFLKAVDAINDTVSLAQLKEVAAAVTKNLSDAEKEMVKSHYRKHMKFLKDEPQYEIIINHEKDITTQPEQPAQPAELETHEKVLRQLKNAKSIETLDIAADLIRECDADKQESLKVFYTQKRKELGNDH